MPFFVIRLLFLVPVSLITILWFPLMHVMYIFVCFLINTSPQFSLFFWNIMWKAHLMFSFDPWARKYEPDKRYQSAAHNISPDIKKGIWCIKVFSHSVLAGSGLMTWNHAVVCLPSRGLKQYQTVWNSMKRRDRDNTSRTGEKNSAWNVPDFSKTPFFLHALLSQFNSYFLVLSKLI